MLSSTTWNSSSGRLLSPISLSSLIASARELEELQRKCHSVVATSSNRRQLSAELIQSQAALAKLPTSDLETLSHCSLCNHSFPDGAMSAHLQVHCDSLYQCPHCAAFFTGGVVSLKGHFLEQHQDVFSDVNRIVMQAISWIIFYSHHCSALHRFTKNDHLLGPPRTWCPSCVSHFPGDLLDSTCSPGTMENLLTHICMHLGYLRYQCRLCPKTTPLSTATLSLGNWLASTLSYLAPTMVRDHLDQHHRFEYELYSGDEIIFSRFMTVGVIERALRYIHQSSPWWTQHTKSDYTKADIEQILERDRDEEFQAQKRRDIARYCANQEKQFLALSEDSYATMDYQDDDSNDSLVIEIPLEKSVKGSICLNVKRVSGTNQWTVARRKRALNPND